MSGAGPGLTAWRAAQRGPTDVTVTEPPGGLVLHSAAAWPALRLELWSIEPGNDLQVHAPLEAGRVTWLEERAPTGEELRAWGDGPDG